MAAVGSAGLANALDRRAPSPPSVEVKQAGTWTLRYRLCEMARVTERTIQRIQSSRIVCAMKL
jgi:hypothetical protein